jgi:hypothetical protein
MLDDQVSAMHNPHILSGPAASRVENCSLITLADILPSLKDFAAHVGTAHLMHIYQHTGSKLDLIQRIDWQTRVKQEVPSEDVLVSPDAFQHLIGGVPDAILVADYGKGVVSEALIRWLLTVAPNARWYVSAKDWRPSWLALLVDADVQLIVITQVAAQLALMRNDIDVWTTRSGCVGERALQQIEELALQFHGSIVIAQPGGWELIARDRGISRLAEGIVVSNSGPSQLDGLPQTSYFTAAAVAYLLNNPSMPVKELVQRSQSFAHAFLRYESQRLEKLDVWTPVNQPSVDVFDTGVYHALDCRTFNWAEEKAGWVSSLSKCGVMVDGDRGKILQLWRTMTEVDGYVCCVKTKRQVLQTLVRQLYAFSRSGRRQQKSWLLIASPGSGKTFLVKRLAKSIGCRFLPFNITQMLSKTDILDCFDSIATTQAQSPEDKVLVFVDEINAKLGSQQVYDSFLAPLEEGIYIRGGKAFHIEPCLWVFAGTEHPLRAAGGGDRSQKAEDFLSRLSSPPLDLTIKPDDIESLKEARIEKVYQGVAILQSFFPDVVAVSERVLHAFHSLPPLLPVRDLEKFIRAFAGVQYGEVRSRNIPMELLQSLSDDISGYENTSDSEMVQIVR